MIPFGQWLPDQSDLNNPGATVAQNVIPAARGYRPLRSLVPYSSATTSASKIQGIAAFKDSGGAVRVFAGTATTLEQMDPGDGSLADVSRPAGYTAVDRWRYITFGNDVIAAAGTATPLQIKNLNTGSGVAFEDLTDSPQAQFIATVKDFIVTAHTSTANVGSFEVRWSEINPSLPSYDPGTGAQRYWYDLDGGTPGDATSGLANQADSQVIADAGEITGLVGGEFGVVFLERAIARMQYVGSPLFFTFEKVETDRGCAYPGSIAAIGPNQAFFLSRDGFMLFNGANSEPIGSEKIDRYFFDDLAPGYAEKITSTIDPTGTNVIWSYVSNDSADGEPDKLLIYNWATGSWSSAAIAHQSIGAARTLPTSLESMTTTLDSFTVSFDSGLFAGGAFLLVGTKDNKIQAFTGTPLDATIETAEIEPAPLQRSLIRSVTPYVTNETGQDAPTVTAQVLSRSTQTVEPTASAASSLNASNFCPTRANGRYHRVRLNITGEWRYALGADIDAVQSGKR
jgi:hypothetical protein